MIQPSARPRINTKTITMRTVTRIRSRRDFGQGWSGIVILLVGFSFLNGFA